MTTLPRLTRLQESKRDRHAQPLLESIYADLQQLWIRQKYYASQSRSSVFHNPFIEWSTWPALKTQRYWKCVNKLGRDVPAILSHSETFVSTLKAADQDIFELLIPLISENASSLRMFVVTRGIPYRQHYYASPLPKAVGPLNLSLGQCPTASHPHELFLTSGEEIELCRFKHRLMENTNECLYNPANFKWSKTRDQNPGWPREWPYPFDPSTPRRSTLPPHTDDPRAPWLLSDCCNKRCNLCTCDITALERNTIVEITEFPKFASPLSPLTPALKPSTSNRGVRSLQSIKEGTILGEYTGDYVPYNSARFFRDEAFAHSLRGPAYHERLEDDNRSYDSDETEDDENLIEEKKKAEEHEHTVDILAGRRGNWTRFVNETKDQKLMNVQFEQQVYCKKLRILCVALRDISFGQELLTSYGETYWEDVRGTEW